MPRLGLRLARSAAQFSTACKRRSLRVSGISKSETVTMIGELPDSLTDKALEFEVIAPAVLMAISFHDPRLEDACTI